MEHNRSELALMVEKGGGVWTTTMEKVRDEYGAGRLGVHVLGGIARWLAGEGIGHYPNPLPDYQHLPVRLYRRDSPVGNLIEAVLDLDPKRDEELRDAATGEDKAKLQKIRELVCP